MRQTASVTVLTAAGGAVEAPSSQPAALPSPLPAASRRAPLVVAAVVPAVVGLLFLNADLLLGPHPAFLPAFLTLVLACDLLTAVLLVEQYRAGGGPRVLALSAAYVWSAAIVVPHALVFGGLFTPTGLLGASPSSAPWLWAAWHTGLPVLIGLALAPWPAGLEARLGSLEHRGRRLLLTHGTVLAAAVGTTALVTAGADRIPTIIVDGDYTVLTERFGPWIVALCLLSLGAALVGVLGRRDAQGIEAWAIVAVVATTGDATLTLFSESRFTVGWYGARALALTAATVVLLAMLREVTALHRQVLRDSVRLETTNRQLLDAQNLREHMVAVVTHDMRTPLTGLQGYLELLSEAGGDLGEERQATMIDRSRMLTRRLTLMTEDMLAVATTDRAVVALEPAPLLLATELQACAEVFPDLDLRLECEPGIRVQADPLRLQQVLVNLVRNAQAYGAEPVVLAARSLPGLPAAPGPALVELAVSDAGAGVPADFVPQLFDSYTRAEGTGRRGSGLGLSVVRELVEAHGGRVSYDAAANAFRVVLPAPAELSLVEPVEADPVA